MALREPMASRLLLASSKRSPAGAELRWWRKRREGWDRNPRLRRRSITSPALRHLTPSILPFLDRPKLHPQEIQHNMVDRMPLRDDDDDDDRMEQSQHRRSKKGQSKEKSMEDMRVNGSHKVAGPERCKIPKCDAEKLERPDSPCPKTENHKT